MFEHWLEGFCEKKACPIIHSQSVFFLSSGPSSHLLMQSSSEHFAPVLIVTYSTKKKKQTCFRKSQSGSTGIAQTFCLFGISFTKGIPTKYLVTRTDTVTKQLFSGAVKILFCILCYSIPLLKLVL